MRNNWNVKNGALQIELRFFGKWYTQMGWLWQQLEQQQQQQEQSHFNMESMCSFSYGTDKLLLLYTYILNRPFHRVYSTTFDFRYAALALCTMYTTHDVCVCLRIFIQI